MMNPQSRKTSRIREFLSGWALFDTRQVLMIMMALAALLTYAYMSGGWS